MKNRLRLTSCLIVLVLLSPTRVLAETVQQTFSTLTKTYERMESLQADFTQTTQFADFDTKATSKGKVFFKKGKMRWDYFSPNRQQIFVDGDHLLHYVPEHNQAIKSQIGRRTGLPINLFADIGKMQDLFAISQKQKHELTLIPKEKTSQLTQMVLTLMLSPTPPDLLIQKVVLYEENNNRSTFVFHDFHINKKFQDDPFAFQLPKDAEVIER
jgi:outer membrane lipoprotein-sorting protein